MKKRSEECECSIMFYNEVIFFNKVKFPLKFQKFPDKSRLSMNTSTLTIGFY